MNCQTKSRSRPPNDTSTHREETSEARASAAANKNRLPPKSNPIQLAVPTVAWTRRVFLNRPPRRYRWYLNTNDRLNSNAHVCHRHSHRGARGAHRRPRQVRALNSAREPIFCISRDQNLHAPCQSLIGGRVCAATRARWNAPFARHIADRLYHIRVHITQVHLRSQGRRR